ncbi:MAG: hypothetical protein Q7J67_08135 [bacterium]|nr:hypothetical protein [bacterium]
MEKTIGQLIDELSICNIKIWHLQDIVSKEENEAKIAKAAKQIITENTLRCNLTKEIDGFFNIKDLPYSKTKIFNRGIL